MLASIPSQHLESDCPPCRNPKRDSTSTNHALDDPQAAEYRDLHHVQDKRESHRRGKRAGDHTAGQGEGECGCGSGGIDRRRMI